MNQERAYAESIKKNSRLWGDIKVDYAEHGGSFGSLLGGIHDFEKAKVKEKEEYADVLKECVNTTISKSHKSMNACLEKFLSEIDAESKRLSSYEKETEKRYNILSNTIDEAE